MRRLASRTRRDLASVGALEEMSFENIAVCGGVRTVEEAANKILRYEAAAEKKFDWALQKLLESQQRRRKAQAPVSPQGPGDQ